MLSVLSQKKQGFRFYFALFDGGATYGGGLTEEGELVSDPDCPQKELMFRTLVFKCMNDGVPEAFTRNVWGLDLARFGFRPDGQVFRADAGSFCLPRDCKEG